MKEKEKAIYPGKGTPLIGNPKQARIVYGR
jgi:hypothetical protein